MRVLLPTRRQSYPKQHGILGAALIRINVSRANQEARRKVATFHLGVSSKR